MQKNEFVNKLYGAAKAACAGTPIFPVLCLAEGACESGWLSSELSTKYNNIFGVKAYPDWKGKVIVMHTKEYHADGTPYYIDAPFKWYDSYQQSFEDYVKLVDGQRYAATGTLTATTPEEQIQDIAAGGYSTSKSYAAVITSIVHELTTYCNAL